MVTLGKFLRPRRRRPHRPPILPLLRHRQFFIIRIIYLHTMLVVVVVVPVRIIVAMDIQRLVHHHRILQRNRASFPRSYARLRRRLRRWAMDHQVRRVVPVKKQQRPHHLPPPIQHI